MSAPEPLEPELPALSRALRLMFLYGLIGASTGLCLWALASGSELLAYVTLNKLSSASRRALLSGMGVTTLTSVAAGAFLARFGGGLAAAERLACRLSPLVLVGFLPLLVQYKLWIDRDLGFLVLVVGFCLALQRLLSVALGAEALPWVPAITRASGRIKHLPLLVALAAAAFYAIYFSVVTTTSHYNFCTSAFDLGIEDNLVWNAAHGEALFRTTPLGGNMRHGGYHQTYFSYVLALVYRFVPRAETLLVIQSLFLGAAAVPLYFIARPRIGAFAGAVVCGLYVLYAPLHGANLYDFHYQPFLVFFVLLLFYLLDNRHDWWAAGTALLTLSVREDMGIMLIALGAYLALSGRRPRGGLLLSIAGATHFVVLKLFIMPTFFMAGESSYAYIYAQLLPEGERGFGGVLKTIIANPGFVLGTLLTQEKLVYALQIFAPLAFLPLRRSLALVLLLPGALFTLLSTGYPAAIMTSFQYTAYWAPMVFLGAVLALEAVGRSEQRGIVAPGSKRAWLMAMGVAMLITSNRYGVVFQRETARGAYDSVRLKSTPEDHQNHADFEALAAQIPRSAKVVAAEWLVSHISNRRDAYTLRGGVLDAEYILFWLHPKLRYDERPLLRTMLSPGGGFGVVEQRGLFVLAQRGYSRRLNAGVIREL